ncbi:large ribosomal subunit protein uL3m [Euwallacea fornicatus]|uniref:large ribosomal subunit protein uL3m n=1 Tax=Euwallacea fornicatus TaxID=995702 RepID=UPI00339062A3
MTLTLNISKSCCSGKFLKEKFRLLSLASLDFKREKHLGPPPKLRNPTWLTPKIRKRSDDELSPENSEFIKEVLQDQVAKCTEQANQIIPNKILWTPNMARTGVIAKKIGIYPMWLKNGTKISTTLLQVLDNHVVKYYPPGSYESPRQSKPIIKNKKGCLLIGAEIGDPTSFTKEYCGLFKNSGVLPTKYLGIFYVSPDAALPLGTTINVQHFQVGNFVDVRGKTIDRGFQGVMKRHGFSGMPASHGVTKTHRRGGNIGGGGEKGRVWPGTKMPGHMGNRYRIAKGLKVWRINTKYNVLWVSGQAIPGETNSIVYIYDTILPLRKPQKDLPFPTFFDLNNENVVEDIYDDQIHQFSDPTILYDEK